MSTAHPADALRDGFSGDVLRPAQPGYEEARRVFNRMIRPPAGADRPLRQHRGRRGGRSRRP